MSVHVPNALRTDAISTLVMDDLHKLPPYQRACLPTLPVRSTKGERSKKTQADVHPPIQAEV